MPKRRIADVDGAEREEPCPKAPALDMKRYSVAPSLSPAWFLLRAIRITASVLGVICGLSPYCTPWLHFERMFADPYYQMEPTDATCYGHRREPDNIRVFCEWSGNCVLECPYRTSTTYAWIGATPDGLILSDALRNGEAALLECKCPYYHFYDAPPPHYVAQMFAQMHAYQIPVIYFSVQGKQDEMRVWRITWDDAYWAWLMVRATRFWTCVQARVEPTEAMIPMVSEPAKQLAVQGEDARAAICRDHRLEPWMLPPPLEMELLRFDAELVAAH